MLIPIPSEPPLPEGYEKDPASRKLFERRYFLLRIFGLLVMLAGPFALYLCLRQEIEKNNTLFIIGLLACWFGGLLLLIGSILIQRKASAMCAKCGRIMRVEVENSGSYVYLCDNCRSGFRRIYMVKGHYSPSAI